MLQHRSTAGENMCVADMVYAFAPSQATVNDHNTFAYVKHATRDQAQ